MKAYGNRTSEAENRKTFNQAPKVFCTLLHHSHVLHHSFALQNHPKSNKKSTDHLNTSETPKQNNPKTSKPQNSKNLLNHLTLTTSKPSRRQRIALLATPAAAETRRLRRLQRLRRHVGPCAELVGMEGGE